MVEPIKTEIWFTRAQFPQISRIGRVSGQLTGVAEQYHYRVDLQEFNQAARRGAHQNFAEVVFSTSARQ